MPSIDFSLDDVLTRYKSKEPGLYNLKELFGEDWANVRRPRHLGRLFRAEVRRNEVPRVRWVGQRSDRSQEYEVVTLGS